MIKPKVLTSGNSLIGTYTFSDRVMFGPAASGNTNGSFFLPLIWKRFPLTLPISENLSEETPVNSFICNTVGRSCSKEPTFQFVLFLNRIQLKIIKIIFYSVHYILNHCNFRNTLRIPKDTFLQPLDRITVWSIFAYAVPHTTIIITALRMASYHTITLFLVCKIHVLFNLETWKVCKSHNGRTNIHINYWNSVPIFLLLSKLLHYIDNDVVFVITHDG